MMLHGSPERDAAIIRRFHEGALLREIAAEFGLTVGALSQWLCHRGLRRHERPLRRVSDEDVRRAAALRRDGKSYRQIAEALGCSTTRVGTLLYHGRAAGLCWKHAKGQRKQHGIIEGAAVTPTEPVFPPEDDFELEPKERARLEEVRRARWEAWNRRYGAEAELTDDADDEDDLFLDD